MPKLIAFLRAINVGGHTVKMDHLRQLFESIGLSGVETFIASGNVLFDDPSSEAKDLERQIEMRLQAALGYEVATFIRSGAELAAVAAYQPFPAPDLEQAGAFNIAFLTEPLDDASTQKVMALTTTIDGFHVYGREIYWLCRQKQSESTFSNAVLERTLKRQATLRGANTVRKMVAKWFPNGR